MNMMCESAAGGREDGYVTRAQALEVCVYEPWKLDALTKSFRSRGPFLHQPGQKCAVRNCIDDTGWDEDYEYRVCGYNKKTPMSKERKLKEAKRRDLGSSKHATELKSAARARAGGCCMYCRSGPMKPVGMGHSIDKRRAPQFDHPDPKRHAEGGKNFELACARCNRLKTDNDVARTPEEAGLVLLPYPTPEQIAYWHARGERQFDIPEPGQPSPADTVPDTPSDTTQDTEQHTERSVSEVVSGSVSLAVSGVDTARPESAGEGREHPPISDSARSRSGQDRAPLGVCVPGSNDSTRYPDP